MSLEESVNQLELLNIDLVHSIVNKDNTKRDTILNKFKEAYDSSEFYSIKYLSGCALGIDMDNEINNWTMRTPSIHDAQREKTLKDTIILMEKSESEKVRSFLKTIYEQAEYEENIAEIEQIGNALGYSKFKIWRSKNQEVVNALSWLALLGFGAGGGYLIYELLSQSP